MAWNWWMAMLLALPILAADHPSALGQDAAACGRAMSSFLQADPGMDKFFKTAVGYAVFPSVAKGGIGIGGAGGSGCAYEQRAMIGEAELAQVTIGLQLGGQTYAEVVFFETADALNSFKKGEMQLSAQVSAVAVQAGASANAKYRDGVAVFTIAKTGFMYEASVGGQKFTFKPKK